MNINFNKIFCYLLAAMGMVVGVAQIIRVLCTSKDAMQIVFFAAIVLGSIVLFSLIRQEED